ncbi:MAG: hypothetical protein LZF61_02250 [Nitrosomonas sp.]|nr:MAG: hypothetical protein LZF61_02250 [Nitrosomonas sp.]
MIRLLAYTICGLIALTHYATAAVPLASSTFDSDTDGWTGLTTDGSPAWSVITSGLLPMYSTDGAPTGSIVLSDSDTQWTYFDAPAKFLGNQSAAFGGSLQFDSRFVTAGTSYTDEAEVVLKGAGLTLVYNITDSLSDTWTHFDVALASGNWRVDNIFGGALATDAQLQAVLGGLDALWINAEYFTPVQEAIALDNVMLLSAVPEPQHYLMLLLGFGLLGLISLAQRRNC